MSDPQEGLIRTLCAERDLTTLPADRQRRIARILAGDVVPSGGRDGEASRLITLLKTLPFAGAEVPAGRYAVALGGRNEVEFFVIDRPTEGKWAGYVFVKQQAGDDTYPVKGARKGEVLAAIAVDPTAALLLYGTELGRCGNCGRTLTDDVSREMGIGPDCAANLGIARPSRPSGALRPAAEITPAADDTPINEVSSMRPDGTLYHHKPRKEAQGWRVARELASQAAADATEGDSALAKLLARPLSTEGDSVFGF